MHVWASSIYQHNAEVEAGDMEEIVDSVQTIDRLFTNVTADFADLSNELECSLKKAGQLLNTVRDLSDRSAKGMVASAKGVHQHLEATKFTYMPAGIVSMAMAHAYRTCVVSEAGAVLGKAGIDTVASYLEMMTRIGRLVTAPKWWAPEDPEASAEKDITHIQEKRASFLKLLASTKVELDKLWRLRKSSAPLPPLTPLTKHSGDHILAGLLDVCKHYGSLAFSYVAYTGSSFSFMPPAAL